MERVLKYPKVFNIIKQVNFLATLIIKSVSWANGCFRSVAQQLTEHIEKVTVYNEWVITDVTWIYVQNPNQLALIMRMKMMKSKDFCLGNWSEQLFHFLIALWLSSFVKCWVTHCIFFHLQKVSPGASGGTWRAEKASTGEHQWHDSSQSVGAPRWANCCYWWLLWCSGLGAASPCEIKPIHVVPGKNCPLDELGSSRKVAVCTLCLLQRSVLLLFRLLNRCSCSQPSSILHSEILGQKWLNNSSFTFVLIDKWSNLFCLT